MPFRLRPLILGIVAWLGLAAPVLAGEVRDWSQQDFQRAEQTGRRVMVIISSRWRPSSQDQEPVIWNLANDFIYADVLFLRVDFDRRKDALRDLRVNSDATIIVYKGAQERGRMTGSADELQLRQLLDSAR